MMYVDEILSRAAELAPRKAHSRRYLRVLDAVCASANTRLARAWAPGSLRALKPHEAPTRFQHCVCGRLVDCEVEGFCHSAPDGFPD